MSLASGVAPILKSSSPALAASAWPGVSRGFVEYACTQPQPCSGAQRDLLRRTIGTLKRRICRWCMDAASPSTDLGQSRLWMWVSQARRRCGPVQRPVTVCVHGYLQDCNGVDRRFAGRALAACTGASHLGQCAEGEKLIPKVDMRRATNNLKCVAHRM